MRIYNLIFKTIFPLIFLRSIYKSLRFGENFSRFLEKLSFIMVKKVLKKLFISTPYQLAKCWQVENLSKKFKKISWSPIINHLYYSNWLSHHQKTLWQFSVSPIYAFWFESMHKTFFKNLETRNDFYFRNRNMAQLH